MPLAMAEAIGLAANLAGLIGLAGQLLEGCLFVKDFLEDIKSAPQEIKTLSEEIGILSSAARSTTRLIERLKEPGLTIDQAEYEPALRQCIRTVQILGQEVEGYVKKGSGDGGMKWWDKMKVASKKKSLGSHIERLERAKTQIHMVQLNISL
jgi:hypothetical protein